VGTLQLIQHPAQVDIVGKSIAPPSYFIELKGAQEVPEHQLNFLEALLDRKREDLQRDLNFFGSALHEKINGPGFEWSGLGTLTRSTQRLPITVASIQPVTAEKVTRPDAEHQILVGDKHRTSVQMTERRMIPELVVKKKNWYVLAGWILLLLSVLVIAYFLYTGRFNVNAAGSKQKVVGNHSFFRNSFS
jgi:hypothetical protein